MKDNSYYKIQPTIDYFSKRRNNILLYAVTIILLSFIIFPYAFIRNKSLRSNDMKFDSDIIPESDGSIDLGSGDVTFKDGYFQGLFVNGGVVSNLPAGVMKDGSFNVREETQEKGIIVLDRIIMFEEENDSGNIEMVTRGIKTDTAIVEGVTAEQVSKTSNKTKDKLTVRDWVKHTKKSPKTLFGGRDDKTNSSFDSRTSSDTKFDNMTITGTTKFNGIMAAAGSKGTFGTFSKGDTRPSVSTGNLWKTHTVTVTITAFDDGITGQTITVISTGAITYDVTSSILKGGSTNIVTASGDVTKWTYDGTNWYLDQFMDVSADMSSVGGGGGGGGGLSGLGSTDHAILRTNGTGGGTAQGTGVIIDDNNNVSGFGTVTSTIATGTPCGSGFDGAEACDISVGEYNSEIVTTIYVDLDDGGSTNINSSGSYKVIGEDSAPNAYLTKITTSVNGLIYRAEMVCLEVPTGGSMALSLFSNPTGTFAEGFTYNPNARPSQNWKIIYDSIDARSGDINWTLSKMTSTTVPDGGIQDGYIYLLGGQSSGTYTAGKFLIRFYGAKTTGL